jgi:hypothetical protein
MRDAPACGIDHDVRQPSEAAVGAANRAAEVKQHCSRMLDLSHHAGWVGLAAVHRRAMLAVGHETTMSADGLADLMEHQVSGAADLECEIEDLKDAVGLER